jgi:hypothetical protein
MLLRRKPPVVKPKLGLAEYHNNRTNLPELEPTPMTVVPPTKSIIPQPVKIPDILMTPPLLTALVRAEHEVTVVPAPLPPPVTPAAYPTSPSTAAAPHVFPVPLPLVEVELVPEVVDVLLVTKVVDEAVVATAPVQ